MKMDVFKVILLLAFVFSCAENISVAEERIDNAERLIGRLNNIMQDVESSVSREDPVNHNNPPEEGDSDRHRTRPGRRAKLRPT